MTRRTVNILRANQLAALIRIVELNDLRRET